MARPRKGTSRYLELKRIREGATKKVVEVSPLTDGWWRFDLECGHACRILLGRYDTKIETLRCYHCAEALKQKSA